MTIIQQGDFCWTELSSPNLSVSKNFYQEIFQWDFTDHSTPHGNYMMFKVGEHDLGGAYELNPEMQAEGVPSVWSAYVLVEDVEKVAKHAKQLGAHMIREPMDVMEAGKMAVFADPTGAVISIWQTHGKPGIPADKSLQGVPSWFELLTSDMKKAGDFYTTLFGWVAEKSPLSSPVEYVTFKNQGQAIAGMHVINDEKLHIPPHWGVYFTVSNLDKTLEKSVKMGSSMLYEPINIPEVGRFTALQDPEGVVFSIIQYNKALA